MEDAPRPFPRFDSPTGRSVNTSRAAARVRAGAIGAFSELGFHGTTTREIASRLGLSAAAIYPHYDSKQSLLYEIVVEAHVSAHDALKALPLAAAASPDERLSAATRALLAWHAENSTMARVANFEMKSLTDDQYAHVRSLRRRTSAFFRAIIEEGALAGVFRVDDPTATAEVITSLCVDVCRWFPTTTQDDPQELGEFYAGVALRIAGVTGA
jgi:AcrR family transcriptional regulator